MSNHFIKSLMVGSVLFNGLSSKPVIAMNPDIEYPRTIVKTGNQQQLVASNDSFSRQGDIRMNITEPSYTVSAKLPLGIKLDIKREGGTNKTYVEGNKTFTRVSYMKRNIETGPPPCSSVFPSFTHNTSPSSQFVLQQTQYLEDKDLIEARNQSLQSKKEEEDFENDVKMAKEASLTSLLNERKIKIREATSKPHLQKPNATAFTGPGYRVGSPPRNKQKRDEVTKLSPPFKKQKTSDLDIIDIQEQEILMQIISNSKK